MATTTITTISVGGDEIRNPHSPVKYYGGEMMSQRGLMTRRRARDSIGLSVNSVHLRHMLRTLRRCTRTKRVRTSGSSCKLTKVRKFITATKRLVKPPPWLTFL